MATKNVPVVFLAAGLALFIGWIVSGYLVPDMALVAGAALMPLLLGFSSAANTPETPAKLPHTGKTYWRFAIGGAICLAVAGLIPARTLYTFSWGFSIFFLLENWRSRVHWQPVVALVLMSSLVVNWVMVFGFPLRLFLSKLAAQGLTTTGFAAQASGNLIVMEGREYTVDPACMGLSMIQVAFLFLLALTAMAERRDGRILPGWANVLLIVATGLLAVVYNLMRIILLCLFNWMPGSFLHEAGGLFGLILYVFLPLGWLVPQAHRQWAVARAIPQAAAHCSRTVLGIYLVLLLATAMGAAHHEGESEQSYTTPLPPISTSGMERTVQQHGVVQYYGNGILMYLKPIVGFYSSEHSPLICWVGSGFQMKESKSLVLPNQLEVYAGVLENEKGERLYTSWWYDNGIHPTASQWEWRKRDAMGEPPYFLVNITASHLDTLMEKLATIPTAH